jgi:DNA-binding CsgD family transcriptional regulator
LIVVRCADKQALTAVDRYLRLLDRSPEVNRTSEACIKTVCPGAWATAPLLRWLEQRSFNSLTQAGARARAPGAEARRSPTHSPKANSARCQEDALREAQKALGPDRARAAERRGTAMSPATAAEYALLLTAPSPPPAAAPGTGALSARERELVTLVAQGRTDAQIATQLYISIRTVRSHLDRIKDKTGCRRADLTRLALSAGLI